jgi:hypothetical protein
MATSRSTGRPDIAEAIAVAIATPALGPSLGMAPAGTCTWTSIEPRRSPGDGQLARVGRGVRHRGPGGLLHHVAELAGEDQAHAAPAGFDRRLVGFAEAPGSRRIAASTNMMSPPTGV